MGKDIKEFDPALEDVDDVEVEKAKDRHSNILLKKGFPVKDGTLDDANLRRNVYYGLPPDFGPSYGKAVCTSCNKEYITLKSERPFCPDCGSIVKLSDTEEIQEIPKVEGSVKICEACHASQYTNQNCTLCGTKIKSEETMNIKKKVKADNMGVKDVDQIDVKSGDDGDEDIDISLDDGEDEVNSFDEEINEGAKENPTSVAPIDEQLNELNDDPSIEKLNVKAGDEEDDMEEDDEDVESCSTRAGDEDEEIDIPIDDEEETESDDMPFEESLEEIESEDDEEDMDVSDEGDDNTDVESDDDEDIDMNIPIEDEETASEDDVEEEQDNVESDDDVDLPNDEDEDEDNAEAGDEDMDDEDDMPKDEVLTFALATFKEDVTKDRIVAHLFNEHTENPQWNITIDGMPVAAICLADQSKPEEVAALFVSPEYGDILCTAMENYGPENMLKSVNARLFVNEVENKALAKKMQKKATAKLKGIYQKKILAMVNDFTDAFNIAIAGFNKNSWEAPNMLKASLYKQFKKLGIKNPTPYIEAAFEASEDQFYTDAVNKALEIMAEPAAARDVYRKMVGESGHNDVISEDDEIQDEEQDTNEKLVEGNFPINTGHMIKASTNKIRLNLSNGFGMGLNS